MRHIQSIPSMAFAITLSLAFFACSDSSGDDNEEISSSSALSSSSAEISSSSVGELSSSSSELNEESSSSSEDLSSSSEAESSSSIAESSSSSVVSSSSSFDGYWNPNIKYGTLDDKRDGKSYRTVVIGTQTWMAENLNYNASGSKCYNNEESKCDIYGRFYDWATAMDIDATYNTSSYTAEAKHQGVCPSGWHLPSTAEWNTLTDFVGGLPTAGTKLKANSILWNTNTGTDDYGFSALPGGYGDNGNFNFVGNYGNWWSATEVGEDYAYSRSMNYNRENVFNNTNDKGRFLYGLRCVKD